MVVKEIERTIEKEDDSWLEVWSFKPAYVFPLEYTDMPMLQTAIKHFEEDIERAKELIKVTENLPDGIAKDDVLRAAWMMAVGACDAYFCDAYGDLIARTLRAKDNERGIKLPDRLNHLKIPVIAVINPSINDGWRWRMAARELIEKESVLSLKEIKDLFNQFFSDDNKILNQDTIESWVTHKDAKFRLFGISRTDYKKLPAPAKAAKRKSALNHFNERYESIFQRRNDCIHNCDRPKIALQKIGNVEVSKVVEDVEFLVKVCHNTFSKEFPLYLGRLGFNNSTRNLVCVA